MHAATALGYLAEDTETKRKEIEYHERLFGIRYEKTYFVQTFAEWKRGFPSGPG